MGKASRDKGARRERETVERFRKLGVKAERVPLSGASKYRGNGADVDVYLFGADEAPAVTEVKARKDGRGFTTLENWLGEYDMLVLQRDRADPMVVLPWSTLERIAEALCRGSGLPKASALRLVETFAKPEQEGGGNGTS